MDVMIFDVLQLLRASCEYRIQLELIRSSGNSCFKFFNLSQ
jgi:hypothetical protein